MTAQARAAAHGEPDEVSSVVVGKDVLELLSSAMYVEPLTIYREYVQNAADAIDEARRSGTPAGSVQVHLDPGARSISILDDGVGIAARRFRRVLTAVGASGKRGTAARGFRGVGRLSGLAHARAVTFRSRAAGEDVVSTMTWDCQALRSALRDPADRRDLASTIAGVTEVTAKLGEAGPSFFEVRLDGVPRQGDDRVMSLGAVEDYLCQVAPIPLDPRFTSVQTILDALTPSVSLSDLRISLNGRAPLTRPFRDTLPVTGGRPLRLREPSTFEVPGLDGGVAAVGWVAHHDYEGAIHPSTRVRGLRVRVGDVQIGGDGVLADIFPETRFDAWAVGEVHVLDSRIVPNGRRDDFERNVHFANLKNQLAPLGREVANRCRTSSRDRKRLRDLELEQTAAKEGLSILEQGGLDPEGRDRMALTVELALMRADKLVCTPGLLEDVHRASRTELARLRTELETLTRDGEAPRSPLDHLRPDRRVWYEEMFSLIYDCAQNRSAAKSLVDRIMSKVA